MTTEPESSIRLWTPPKQYSDQAQAMAWELFKVYAAELVPHLKFGEVLDDDTARNLHQGCLRHADICYEMGQGNQPADGMELELT